MVTAEQYTASADELERISRELGDACAPVIEAWAAGPVVGGHLAVIVGRAVEASADHTAAARGELAALAAACRTQAAVAGLGAP